MAKFELETLMEENITFLGYFNEIFILNTSGIIEVQSSAVGWTYGHTLGSDQSTKVYFTTANANSANENFTYLSDFQWSSGQEYVQITVSTVVHDENGSFVGVLVAYIDIDFIYTLMHQTEGLGISGETYLINFDLKWITTSKFTYYVDNGIYQNIEDTILTEQVNTEGIVECLSTHQSVLKEGNLDYRGIAVMGSYHYLEVNDDGLPWVLVVEIEVNEVTAPITVINPSGFVEWETGTTHTINWTSTSSIINVKIDLYRNGILETVLSASTSNEGSYSWTIPSGLMNSTEYQIKITDVSNSSTFDFSEYFGIYSTSYEIPGYELILLIGISSLMILFLIKKLLKKKIT